VVPAARPGSRLSNLSAKKSPARSRGIEPGAVNKRSEGAAPFSPTTDAINQFRRAANPQRRLRRCGTRREQPKPGRVRDVGPGTYLAHISPLMALSGPSISRWLCPLMTRSGHLYTKADLRYGLLVVPVQANVDGHETIGHPA
jgi:hypothetical protein